MTKHSKQDVGDVGVVILGAGIVLLVSGFNVGVVPVAVGMLIVTIY